MTSNAAYIRKNLEDTYDIPFRVLESNKYDNPVFDISPENPNDELFCLHVEIKNKIRVVIEVTPERYAAFTISEMARANVEKKHTFVQYSKLINDQRAKSEFYINDCLVDVSSPNSWPSEWSSYKFRMAKSPIVGDGEHLNVSTVVTKWAALVVGMFLSLLNVVAIGDAETIAPKAYLEGGSQRTLITRYERNPVNRELCLSANGYRCKICGFDFEDFYGDVGKGFIHVHHIIPISEIKEKYLIDPIKDLIPVCPNCHAMLHRREPPYKPDEVRNMIKEQKVKKKE